MKELELKYGHNPEQKPARIFMKSGELPFDVLNGKPGYINFLDALNSWQLVKELKIATKLPAATSFKHVSPAGAAVSEKLSDAYIKARGSDRMSSFGDFIALSDVCNLETAMIIKKEVSDGIIAPGFDDDALEVLKSKRKGNYPVIKMNPDYECDEIEQRDVFGITLEQRKAGFIINESLLKNIVTKNKELPDSAKRDLLLAMITLKYTQSNSVCYTYNGQTIGVGAGQQSRIHCTRLAGDKADIFNLRRHPKVLALPFKDDLGRPNKDNVIDVYLGKNAQEVIGDSVWQNYFKKQPDLLSEDEKKEWLSKITDICLASDAFFPFDDNIRRAKQSGVKYIAQTGGSIRDNEVISTADEFSMVMVFTGLRLFHH